VLRVGAFLVTVPPRVGQFINRQQTNVPVMLRVAWKRFSVGVIVILVALLVVSNAYATPPTPMRVFIAADLTLPSTVSNLPSETFVVLQADGLANRLEGTLFLFYPPSSCATRSVFVSGTLFTNTTTGFQNLTFTGDTPPDPCVGLGQAVVRMMIGPAPEPPDPCILTLHFPSGRTASYAGETASFIVGTVTTTTTSTTSPS